MSGPIQGSNRDKWLKKEMVPWPARSGPTRSGSTKSCLVLWRVVPTIRRMDSKDVAPRWMPSELTHPTDIGRSKQPRLIKFTKCFKQRSTTHVFWASFMPSCLPGTFGRVTVTISEIRQHFEMNQCVQFVLCVYCVTPILVFCHSCDYPTSSLIANDAPKINESNVLTCTRLTHRIL